MTIGDKIKKIRTFRKMTQAELGAALGWGEKGANRLAQYETNYRVPKKELVTEMAKILDVNPWTLYDATTMDATEFMELLFWIDEFNPSAINLFLATPTDGMTVIANARINDFGVGVLAKRTMHAPQNNVYGRKNHAARVSFTQPEQ